MNNQHREIKPLPVPPNPEAQAIAHLCPHSGWHVYWATESGREITPMDWPFVDLGWATAEELREIGFTVEGLESDERAPYDMSPHTKAMSPHTKAPKGSL